MSFKKIYIFGADHSWHQSIYLDKNNKLMRNDGHFYSNKKTNTAITEDGVNYQKIHDHFFSFSRVFRLYHTINQFDKEINIKIINLSSISWIDAFDKNE